MGWLWSSSSTKDTPNPTTPEAVPQNAAPPKKLTPDEQADLEFNQILADLRQEDQSLNSKSKSASADESPKPTEPISSIAPESLYADTMSCRTAFDYAFFCQSFGGQFVNVYRYGEMRSCSEHWENFRLCMRTKGWSEDARRNAIRDHNRKKAIKYKTGPSSEDIWDVRLEPAKDAFQGDFAALERDIEAAKAAGTA
ncbi:hypothetical protein N7468_009801 [Penicillium chermesinum]|uniref:Early meiotic induction protein 1 n=1 Tax=Penicillium chermesinum TaxID=63820 RepID=A0A9W9NBH9_9EURO|nr:uncharacterized protein N7468_009801 [Penicillium chermesinum]KAJ5216793.1 hypothetical protein N7468_009801 [Penicillium chermesinum]